MYPSVVFVCKKLRKDVVFLDYVIKNHKNMYIKLDENGRAVTCGEKDKALFEFHKASNILESLPKTLKKMGFKVDCIPDVGTKEIKPKVITKSYTPPENVMRWIEKFGVCEDVLNEARQRKEELIGELSDIDKKFSDMIHQIELEDKVNMFIAWQERNKIKEIREKRRYIKDELLIVGSILGEINSSCLQREKVQKIINGLSNRKYTFRIVEDE